MKSSVTRRQFIGSITAAAGAPSILHALEGRERSSLPLAFSTLGCPKWDWGTVLRQASQMGYTAIELRGIQGDMDLPNRPEFKGSRLTESMKDLEALRLRVSDLGSSATLHFEEGAQRTKHLDDGRRFIDLAHRLNVPHVRVFGNQLPKDQTRDATIDRVISGLRELGQYAQGSGVSVIIESHGDFNDSPTLVRVLDGAAMPNVALLWDAHHTSVFGKEDPAETFKQVGRFVRHTHLKDSRPAGDNVRYVLPGSGTVPLRETVRVLAANGYRGYYCFEWEKVWHPEIEEPEIAFPLYVKIMSQYLDK